MAPSVASVIKSALNSSVYWRKQVVGSFCCRMDPNEKGDDFVFYLMTFGVMPHYRRLGIGHWMLHQIAEEGKRLRITTIRLHVHVENREALRFYEQRGFVQVERISNYYRRLVPPDAFLLVRH